MQSSSTTIEAHHRSIFTCCKTSMVNRDNIAYLSKAPFIVNALKFRTYLLHDGQFRVATRCICRQNSQQ